MQTNKGLKRVLALLLCAVMLVLGVAQCEENDAAETSAVVATVNGKDVTQAQVDEILYNLISYFSQSYDVSSEDILTALKQMSLELAVQYELMEQKAVELGLHDPTEEEQAALEAEVAEQWEEMGDILTVYGYTQEDLLEEAQYNFWYEKVAAYMVEGAEVTDEAVQARYEELVAQDEYQYKDNVLMYEYMTQMYGQEAYYTPEGYRGVTHILLNVDEELMNAYQELAAKLEEQSSELEAGIVEGESEATDETEAAAEPVTQEMVDAARQAMMDSVQPTVDEIMQKLADGASFDDLIVEYGNDPGMSDATNKELGYSVNRDSVIWDPAFVEGAFSGKMQKVGDVSDPVLGNYGVHIICYKRDVPAGAVELTDDLRASIREALLADVENERFEEVMTAWLEEADIAYTAVPLGDAEPDASAAE